MKTAGFSSGTTGSTTQDDSGVLRFACGSCGQSLEAEPILAGTTLACPSCNTSILIPTPKNRHDRDHSTAYGLEDGGDLGVKSAVTEAVTEFKQLDYNFLLPLGKIFSTQLLRLKAVRWVLLFGLYPFVLFNIYSIFDLQTEDLLRMIELYFCTFWALYFYGIMQVSRTVWKRGVGYAFFTTVIGIPILFAVQTFPVVRSLYAGASSFSPMERAVAFICGVGPFEEICKALPLLLLGLHGRKISGPRDGVFLGIMSGLGFALSEGVLYMLQSTILAARFGGSEAFDNQLMTIFHRAMSAPLLYAAWAGTVGWFIGVAATRSGRKWPIIALGLVFMAVLHGVFDLFSDGVMGSLLAGVSFIIFMAYVSFGDTASAIRETATVRTAPADKQTFCPSCGYGVPAGNKFCPHCGHQQGDA